MEPPENSEYVVETDDNVFLLKNREEQGRAKIKAGSLPHPLLQ
jgi:hypothetical protein